MAVLFNSIDRMPFMAPTSDKSALRLGDNTWLLSAQRGGGGLRPS